MVSAMWGAEAAVEELLRWGADPDVMDKNLDNALSLSLLSNSPAITARLASLTNKSLQKTKITAQIKRTRKVLGKVFKMNVMKPFSSDVARESLLCHFLQNFASKRTHITEKLPKYVEFQYEDKIGKILELLQRDNYVTYHSLLDALHLPTFHEFHYECQQHDCKQRDHCDRLRQVELLVKLMVKEMGEINPVFENLDQYSSSSKA